MYASEQKGGGRSEAESRQERFMIPDLNHNGYLPPGIHPATLDEIAIELGNRKRFAEFTGTIFATDRNEFPKGLIEVLP